MAPCPFKDWKCPVLGGYLPQPGACPAVFSRTLHVWKVAALCRYQLATERCHPAQRSGVHMCTCMQNSATCEGGETLMRMALLYYILVIIGACMLADAGGMRGRYRHPGACAVVVRGRRLARARHAHLHACLPAARQDTKCAFPAALIFISAAVPQHCWAVSVVFLTTAFLLTSCWLEGTLEHHRLPLRV